MALIGASFLGPVSVWQATAVYLFVLCPAYQQQQPAQLCIAVPSTIPNQSSFFVYK